MSSALLDKLVKGMPYIPDKDGAPTTRVGYRAARSYIPRTYYTIIAVLLSNGTFEAPNPAVFAALQNQLQKFLDSTVDKWKPKLPHQTNGYIIYVPVSAIAGGCKLWIRHLPYSPKTHAIIVPPQNTTWISYITLIRISRSISSGSSIERRERSMGLSDIDARSILSGTPTCMT